MCAMPPWCLKHAFFFQEMVRKCLELDNWSVFHMALCVTWFYYVDSEKALNNEEDCRERELCVESRKHVLGVFRIVFFLD